jgi:hypothetical protein
MSGVPWHTPREKYPAEWYPASAGAKRLVRCAQSDDPEGSREGFSNVQTPVWGSPILLVDDVRLQIRYLGVNELSQRVKVNATRYCSFHEEQEVLERTNLPTFLKLFENVICIKTSVCPNITLVGNSVPILKHSHIQNNVSSKKIVDSSWSFYYNKFQLRKYNR